VEGLKTNTTLTTLDLHGNDITEEGAKALAEMLQTKMTLTTLYLNNNNIKDEGAKALAEALQLHNTLTTLYLVRNQITEEVAQEVEVWRSRTRQNWSTFCRNISGRS
jgi:Ran GTPase-activating protein (RanGAP) involved in mRNA processing and transport